MSAPFTTVTPENMFSIEVWNEIRRAINERFVNTDWNPTLFTSGDCGYESVGTWQNQIQNSASFFADPVYESGASTDSLETWTFEKLKDGPLNHGAAGQGWRRQVTLGEWEEAGVRQSGDIVGPWILEDLQAALGALKGRINPSYGIANTERRSGFAGTSGSGPFSTIGAATSDATSEYNSFTPVGDGGAPRAIGSVSSYEDGGNTYYGASFESFRADILINLPAAQSEWTVPVRLYVRTVPLFGSFEPYGNFEDNKYTQLVADSFTSNSSAIIEVPTFPSSWLTPFYPSSEGVKSWWINDIKPIIYYDYTNGA